MTQKDDSHIKLPNVHWLVTSVHLLSVCCPSCVFNRLRPSSHCNSDDLWNCRNCWCLWNIISWYTGTSIALPVVYLLRVSRVNKTFCETLRDVYCTWVLVACNVFVAVLIFFFCFTLCFCRAVNIWWTCTWCSCVQCWLSVNLLTKSSNVCGDKKYHLSQKFNLVTFETILQLSSTFMLCLFGWDFRCSGAVFVMLEPNT